MRCRPSLPGPDPAMTARAAVPLLMAALATFPGCGGDRPAQVPRVADREMQVRDSAGIVIVENPLTGAWGESGGWRIATEPSLQIGVVDGSERHQLFRVSDAQTLSDGTVVVANGAEPELRFYDPGGGYLFQAGGPGDGPGEFRRIGAVRVLPGDTVLVVDDALYRFSFFDRSGRFLASSSFAGDQEDAWGSGARFVDPLADGSFLLAGRPNIQGLPPGTHRQQARYRRVAPDGSVLGDVGSWDYRDWFSLAETGTMGEPLFAPRGAVAVWQGRIYHGWSERYEVREHRSDGTLERIVRRAYEPEAVTPSHLDALLDFSMEWWERVGMAVSPAARAGFYDLPSEGTIPPFSGLRLDESGHLWVLRYDIRNLEIFRNLPGEGFGAMQWDVFSPEGHYLGAVHSPPRTRITKIGNDHVLGVAIDAFGVEYVRVHALLREEVTRMEAR